MTIIDKLRDPHRCVGHWPTYSQCVKLGKVERDGKWYCGIHDPEAKAAKQAAKDEAYRAKERASTERADSAKRVGELIKSLVGGDPRAEYIDFTRGYSGRVTVDADALERLIEMAKKP